MWSFAGKWQISHDLFAVDRKLVIKADKPRKPRKSPKFRSRDTKKLIELTDRKAGMVSVNLYTGIQTFKKRVSSAALEDAWESGNWARAMAVIPWDELPGDIWPALASVATATVAAGNVSLEALPPNANKHLRWDTKNPVLRKYITDRTSALVVGIRKESQEVIQDAVARSFTEALTPREVAKQIKGSIGLFPAQERALRNYRKKISAQGISGVKLETMASKYEDHLLNYRSKMIARTEIRGATNAGQQSVWREASNQGLIDKASARRQWVCEGPDPCDECLEMDGEEVGLDEPFIMPDGTICEIPPFGSHPNCFCGVALIA